MKQVLANGIRIMSTVAVVACVVWFGLMILSYQQELRAGITDMAGIHKLDELAARDVAVVEQEFLRTVHDGYCLQIAISAVGQLVFALRQQIPYFLQFPYCVVDISYLCTEDMVQQFR